MKTWLIIILFFTPTLTFAQFDTLVNIPGISDPGQDFATYINALYALSIAIAGLLAVIKLVIAGVKYMLTDIVTSKADAKKDIQGALLGLLVVLAAVLILTVINEDITNADIRINPAAEVPEPPAPAPAVNIDLTYEQGFRSIPVDAPEDQRIAFYVSCNGQIQITSEEIRCYELDPELEVAVINDFTTGAANPADEETLDVILTQYERYLGAILIEDPDIIASIADEIGVTEIYFVTERYTPPLPMGIDPSYEAQVEGVCRQYATANNLSYGSEVSLEQGGEIDQGYFACVLVP